MHPMDPRGRKLGGIETHVRLILAHHPADFRIIFVGVDEIGDLVPGQLQQVDYAGRQIDFLPVARIGSDAINLAGKSLLGSTTFRFATGALRHSLALRRALAGTGATADLQRFEFSLIAGLLGLKTVQMVHGEGRKDQKMDSLIRKLWFLHRFNETIALSRASAIFCVNATIIERLKVILPRAAKKAAVMSVSVETDRFVASAFADPQGPYRLVFAGRLDEFKDPPLMFKVVAALHARLNGALEFHYAGTTDPARYPEFAAIAAFTTRHGFLDAPALAALYHRCHAGILTSFFEGMPCYLLELLAAGRPFAAIRLPQYDPLIVAGISGTLVERNAAEAATVAALCAAFVDLRQAMQDGGLAPDAIHALVEPYSVTRQMGRLFERHRALQRPASRDARLVSDQGALSR
ncbi:MAG: glycosyltransferase [Hyphomicrobiales bacterium]|nr:glycosyltransferase [Hyphomicrobiales bacterium]